MFIASGGLLRGGDYVILVVRDARGIMFGVMHGTFAECHMSF